MMTTSKSSLPEGRASRLLTSTKPHQKMKEELFYFSVYGDNILASAGDNIIKYDCDP